MAESLVSQAIIDWLLSSQTPSIRYLTRRIILAQPETEPTVQTERDTLMKTGAVPRMLSGQTADGHWSGERGYYTPKYVSTHWSMLLLHELQADPTDPRIRQGADFMLADTAAWLERALEKGQHGMTCFWGNLLRYTLPSSPTNHAQFALLTRCLVNEALKSRWTCPHNNELPCAWGCARALWALASLPPASRPDEWREAIDAGLHFLLKEHSLVAADYPTPGRIHRLWFRLNFPLFYQTDILFVLRVLAALDALQQPQVEPALDWLRARRSATGRWRGASPYRSRTWPDLAPPEEVDRWVTLHALQILQAV